MLHEYSIIDGRISRDSGGTIPIDVYVLPDEQERRHLTEDLEIDEHTLASSIDPDETPRIEFEETHIAIILKYPKNYSADDNFLFRVKSMGIFMFADRVVVVVDDNVQLFNSGKPYVRISTPCEVILRILHQTIRHFESHLRVINMCSDEIETEINESSDNRSLLNMFTLEKGLVYYLNALSGNRRVIERIRATAGKFNFTEEHIELLDDLAIENRQFLDQAQVYSQVLSGLMDARAVVLYEERQGFRLGVSRHGEVSACRTGADAIQRDFPRPDFVAVLMLNFSEPRIHRDLLELGYFRIPERVEIFRHVRAAADLFLPGDRSGGHDIAFADNRRLPARSGRRHFGLNDAADKRPARLDRHDFQLGFSAGDLDRFGPVGLTFRVDRGRHFGVSRFAVFPGDFKLIHDRFVLIVVPCRLVGCDVELVIGGGEKHCREKQNRGDFLFHDNSFSLILFRMKSL